MTDYSQNEIESVTIIIMLQQNFTLNVFQIEDILLISQYIVQLSELVEDALLANAHAVSTKKMMHVLLLFLQLIIFFS
ncbi:hypothetical protein TSAR_005074 [Trichomalopsis sarcophagae]|uniref:Uncharacterized protein n=1 Tax=Trichomalopsis sarcophagae TaxID=543379 RepID=A0A232EE58_9HYME|nr:hypothetical protein TSAR_005074 [Trichomalopsis sarcophagae]